MPNRFESIADIIEKVEWKGQFFLGSFVEADIFEVSVGEVKILTESDGRAYFIRQPGGMPTWFDVNLKSKANPNEEVGLNIDFHEFQLEYAELRARQLAASSNNQLLDASDALEALILATLVKDQPVVQALILRISKQFSELASSLLGLLERGNARLRSVIGRTIALSQNSEAWETVLKYMEEETNQGVRADIITAYILNSAGPETAIPTATLERWIGSDELLEALSCVMALSVTGAPTPTGLAEKANEKNRAALGPWLESLNWK